MGRLYPVFNRFNVHGLRYIPCLSVPQPLHRLFRNGNLDVDLGEALSSGTATSLAKKRVQQEVLSMEVVPKRLIIANRLYPLSFVLSSHESPSKSIIPEL